MAVRRPRHDDLAATRPQSRAEGRRSRGAGTAGAPSGGPVTRLLPDPADPDLLATVRVAGERKASDVERQLADAVNKRHTNRHPFLERPVLPDARAKLAAAARAEGAELVFVDASERYDTLVRLIRDAERAMESDGAYQHEIKHWLGGPSGRRDGIPTDAVGPTPLSGQLLELRRYYRPNPLPPVCSSSSRCWSR